jgi:hypothetical protein
MSDFKFFSSQSVVSGWSHVFEGKELYIVDSDNKVVCTISGKEQLLQMCDALGIVGTGIVLTSRK